jgi:NADPH-dependent ferric siderophore reductase
MSIDRLIPSRRPVPDSLAGGRLRGAYLLDLEVVEIRDLVPHVRSLTVASSDLVDFEYGPGQDLMIEFPAGDRSVRRRYTIRRADPTAGTAELEFELHRAGGVATRWVAAAEVGDRLQAIGPRGSIFLNAQAATHLFVADDSAMPAAFAMIEALPSHASATAVLVTPHGARSRPGPEGVADLRELWVQDSELPETIGRLDLETPVAAYVNGEQHLVRHATDHLLSTVLASSGSGNDTIASKAYWRRDRPNAPHGEPGRD